MDFNIKNFLFFLVFFHVHLIQLILADDDVVLSFHYTWLKTFHFVVVVVPCCWLNFMFYYWQCNYDIHYDRLEVYKDTGEFFEHKINNVKKDETANIFIIDATIWIKQDISNDWKVCELCSHENALLIGVFDVFLRIYSH